MAPKMALNNNKIKDIPYSNIVSSSPKSHLSGNSVHLLKVNMRHEHSCGMAQYKSNDWNLMIDFDFSEKKNDFQNPTSTPAASFPVIFFKYVPCDSSQKLLFEILKLCEFNFSDILKVDHCSLWEKLTWDQSQMY